MNTELLGDILIQTVTDKMQEKAKDIQKFEVGKFTVYEKADPFYNSKIFGIRIKYIIGGIALYSIVRSK